MSPLEALACDTPVVATEIGGLAAHLGPFAALTPRRDDAAMAAALMRVARNPAAARLQAQRGRAYVAATWSRDAAFRELQAVLTDAATTGVGRTVREEHA